MTLQWIIGPVVLFVFGLLLGKFGLLNKVGLLYYSAIYLENNKRRVENGYSEKVKEILEQLRKLEAQLVVYGQDFNEFGFQNRVKTHYLLGHHLAITKFRANGCSSREIELMIGQAKKIRTQNIAVCHQNVLTEYFKNIRKLAYYFGALAYVRKEPLDFWVNQLQELVLEVKWTEILGKIENNFLGLEKIKLE